VHIEKNQIESLVGEQLISSDGVLHGGGFEFGLFQGVSDCAARDRLVVHDEDTGGNVFLLVGQSAFFKEDAQKIERGGDCAEGRGVDVFGFFVKLFEQGLQSVGDLSDAMQA